VRQVEEQPTDGLPLRIYIDDSEVDVWRSGSAWVAVDRSRLGLIAQADSADEVARRLGRLLRYTAAL
jgi:hypothetical protein